MVTRLGKISTLPFGMVAAGPGRATGRVLENSPTA